MKILLLVILMVILSLNFGRVNNFSIHQQEISSHTFCISHTMFMSNVKSHNDAAMSESIKNILELDPFDSIMPNLAPQSTLPFDFVHEKRLGPAAVVIHGMLSQVECDELVAFIDKHDRPPSYEGEITMVAASSSTTHRNNQRVCIASEALSAALLARLRPVMAALEQDEISCSPENAHTFLNKGFAMEGNWKIDALNPHFRLCKYHLGGHFGPHYDADFVVDPVRRRSLKTFMLYLNDSYDGGETNFVDSHDLHFDEDKQIYCSPAESVFSSLKARRGDCLVFDHMLLHEGAQVTRGEKYIIRSDLMYVKEELDGGRGQDEAGRQREEALLLYREGARLEEGGEVDAAIQYYKRAFRMCPEIEEACS